MGIAALMVVLAAPAQAQPVDQSKAAFALRYVASPKMTRTEVKLERIFAGPGRFTLESGDERCKGPIKKAAISSHYCFDTNDANSREPWVPQGVSHVSDARSAGVWRGREPVILSWYHRKGEHGADAVQLTFVDQNLKYRHVRLVVPTRNGKDYTQVTDVHAGGVLWYGRYIYVTETKRGLRVFDTNEIYRGKGADGYVMPQVGRWQTRTASDSDDYCRGANPDPRFSYVGIDRTSRSHRILVGEYCGSNDGDSRNGRVVAYPAEDGKPVTRRGQAVPGKVLMLPGQNVQGVAHDGRFWYLSQTGRGKTGPSYLRRTKENPATGALQDDKVVEAPTGAEDLSLERDRGMLWSVTEFDDVGRTLYTMSKTLG
ncbi:hypothetical protein AB0I91_33300 [Actinosynnema sp. NPDC049800]